MERIIIFTSIGSLDAKFSSFAQRLDVSLLEDNALLYYNLENYTFEVSADLQKQGLYFVYHGIQQSYFNSLLGADKINTFILKHQAPGFIFSDFRIVRNGQHEPHCPYYSNIVRIVSDEEGEKIQRIIDVFKYDDVLEKKLELINQIWNWDGKSQLTIDTKLKDFNTAITRFQNVINSNDILSAECRAAFQDFKKALKLEE